MVKLLIYPSLSWSTLVRALVMYYAVGIFSDTNLLTPAADWCALKLDSKIGTESLPEEEKIILKSFLKKSLFNITVQEVMTHQCRIFP